jgi:predicted aldo/keto reductase-like oxidoreductase
MVSLSSASAANTLLHGLKQNKVRNVPIKYRKFGRLDWKASVLGFGTKHLPGLDLDPASIDEIKAQAMFRYAIDRGVNYLDLGYLYDTRQRKHLTRFIGKALKDGYREKIKIAASLPAFRIKSAQDVERYLDAQLRLVQIDKLDFFLLASLDRQTWPRLPTQDVLKRAEAAIADGRLGYLGFAFHDDFQTLRTIVEAYDNWTLGQFQYSFMDVDHHPGTSGLKYAADKGLAVVVSESLKGGRLTKNLPEPVAAIWGDTEPKRSPAEWGLRWVWDHPEIATVVSDMSSIEQVKENIALADSATADSLTVPEELIVNRVRDVYLGLKPIPCTACRGCMPCPLDLDVPRIFELYNDAMMYKDREIPRSLYRDEGHHIQDCNECGSCVKACGQRIPITDWLKKSRRLFDEN